MRFERRGTKYGYEKMKLKTCRQDVPFPGSNRNSIRNNNRNNNRNGKQDGNRRDSSGNIGSSSGRPGERARMKRKPPPHPPFQSA